MTKFEAASLYQEWWKVAAGLATPLAVAIVGFVLNWRLSALAARQRVSDTLLEQRLAVFDAIRSDLNRIFCACFYVGTWLDGDPAQTLEAKRACDARVYGTVAFWEADVLGRYRAFMDVCFATFQERGRPAVLRADAARYKEGFGARWSEQWAALFQEPGLRSAWLRRASEAAGRADGLSYSQDLVLPAYARLMEAFARSFGSGSSATAIVEALRRPRPSAEPSAAESTGDPAMP